MKRKPRASRSTPRGSRSSMENGRPLAGRFNYSHFLVVSKFELQRPGMKKPAEAGLSMATRQLSCVSHGVAPVQSEALL